MGGCLKLKIIVFFLLALAGMKIGAEEEKTEYNYYYRYPVSFGISYKQLFLNSIASLSDSSALKNYDFLLFDVSGNIRVPVKFFPYLQPAVKVGLSQVLGHMIIENSDQTADHDKFDHTQLYGALGLNISCKFSKYLEASLQGYAGISYAIFPNVFPLEEKDRALVNFLGEGGITFSINPNFNISVDITPGFRFQKVITGALNTFDGWSFAVSSTLNFRMGEDPDIARGLYKSIHFDKINIPAVFSALQGYYAEHPLGSILITNKDKKELKDVKISFYQAEYMDSPTPALTLPVLASGESREVDLFAVYSSRILETAGTIPLTGEILLTYNIDDKPGKQTRSVVYTLHDKTALAWDDDRKIAAFITPADNIIKDYGSMIRQSLHKAALPLFNEPLQTAIQVYCALQAAGCLYQADPLSPFTEVKENKFAIDTVNLPRETLKRLTGDCDDLTVLYLSLLASLGVETGFITVPGHIFPAINTGKQPGEYREMYPDRNMFIIVDDRLWVPVEITALAADDFIKAWQAGISEYLGWQSEPEKRRLYVSREAQEIYKPIALRQTDKTVDYPVKESSAKAFTETMRKLSQYVVDEFRHLADDNADSRGYNKLGSIYTTFGRDDEAERTYIKALEIDPKYFYAEINLGDIYFRNRNFTAALAVYHESRELMQSGGYSLTNRYSRLLLRISIAYYMLDDLTAARDYYVKASELAPAGIKQYAYLAGNPEQTTRGSKEEIFNLNTPFIEMEGDDE